MAAKVILRPKTEYTEGAWCFFVGILLVLFRTRGAVMLAPYDPQALNLDTAKAFSFLMGNYPSYQRRAEQSRGCAGRVPLMREVSTTALAFLLELYWYGGESGGSTFLTMLFS